MFKSLKQPGGETHGHFLKGRLCGYGRVEYVGGDSYIGMFKDGKRSGTGEMIFNQFNDLLNDYQPAKFVGEWKFNKRNGQGTMTWPDNSKFEGEWSNDFRVFGKLEMPDHNIYEGFFKSDQFHGVGKIHYEREGLVYEGMFSEGLASNIGKVTNKNLKQTYIGEIEELRQHGVGILIDHGSGMRYEGEFEDDIAVGEGTIIYQNGDTYQG